MKTYTIKEASDLSGLPESTLRYYETMGLIGPIHRDQSSKHRIYNEDDINLSIGIGCLSATGMSIENMRAYLKNIREGKQSSVDQIALLEAQKNHLEKEMKSIILKQRYIDEKISYWKAIDSGDSVGAETIAKNARAIAKEMKSPK